MPTPPITRSIKLKLRVPRQSDTRQAQSLWDTHAAINAAVHHYESCLLAMRQDAYIGNDGNDGKPVSRLRVARHLLKMIRTARRNNGHTVHLTRAQRAEVLGYLRDWYEVLVPSAVLDDKGKPGKGDAQKANAFLSPLVDATSEAGATALRAVENLPQWLGLLASDDPAQQDEARQQAAVWLQSPQGQERLNATQKGNTWYKKAQAQDPGWPDALANDVDKKQAEAAIYKKIRRLRELGVVPLCEGFVAARMPDVDKKVTRWDRLAFRLAVGHLLSWESWCWLAQSEHRKRQEKATAFRSRYLPDTLATSVQALRNYETTRREELDDVALTMNRAFRITLRMVRGWQELREAWLKLAAAERTGAALLTIIAEQQTRLRGKFGDPHLFRWLAQPAQWSLWADREQPDVVDLLARFNAVAALAGRSRETAVRTLPDALLHPCWVQWEAEGGSNLKTYRIRQDEPGLLTVALPLLRDTGAGWVEREERFLLAPSGQFQAVELQEAGRLRYRNESGEVYAGTWGSADLLLERDWLRQHTAADLAAGKIGGAYLKLALNLDVVLPEGWNERRPVALSHFLKACSDNSSLASAIPGLRVLAVDLGVRHFASCAVFTLQTEPPTAGKFAFVAAAGLWAVHERSFVLDLPGEEVDSAGEAWRRQARDELRQLRRALSRYRLIRRMVQQPTTARATLLDDLRLALDEGSYPFEPLLQARLQAGVAEPEPLWDGRVDEVLREFRREFGQVMKDWRTRTRSRTTKDKPRKALGKSMWAIDYLQDVRRLLVSWSLLGRASGDIRRLDGARGQFAARLLAHIDGLKEDRLKTGANLLVQAARGVMPLAGGGRRQAYAPCQVVLFEDLSRYRMRTDRPRWENSLLMEWAHRAIPQKVAQQAALYGIHIADTQAAFSSRFHARTHTPGIRCHRLSHADLQDAGFQERWTVQEPDWPLAALAEGMLIPRDGGEWFVCLNGRGLTQVQADINAAQNLQRRLWTRHGDAFQLSCQRVLRNGVEHWIPLRLGKRLLGALGGYGYLLPVSEESKAARWQAASLAQWRKLGGVQVQDAGQPENDVPELEEIAGLEDEFLERSQEVVVFFRDPSGVMFPADCWYPAKVFWGGVKARIRAQLRSLA